MDQFISDANDCANKNNFWRSRVNVKWPVLFTGILLDCITSDGKQPGKHNGQINDKRLNSRTTVSGPMI